MFRPLGGFIESIHGGSSLRAPENAQTHDEDLSKSLLEEMTAEEAIENDFSMDSRDTSICMQHLGCDQLPGAYFRI